MSAPDQWLGPLRRRFLVADRVAWLWRRPQPALLLGVFFLSLYLLTMGGHFDSPDEELMFQVTRSLAERGAMDIGATASPDLALIGVNGQQYVPYGPVSSILSIPFYELGRGAATLLPGRYSEIMARFAVGLRDPLISAAAGVLFYAVAVELGFGTRVSVLLTLAFGTATLAWPYARYAWSEPVTGFWLLVAVFAVMRAVRNGVSFRWSALCSIAVGLAIGSKITTAVAVPALLVYLFCAGGGSPKTRTKRCIPFVLPLMLPLLALAGLNAVRFGDPLETGYHLSTTDFSGPGGIAGLLVSPSKSLFLFAPVALLGLVGIRGLAAKLPWEAGLCVWLFASHVVAYGLLTIWPGGAAWGPRYLVPALPFIVLPAGAGLVWSRGVARRLYWGSFGVLFALGTAINLGGVLVDQRVVYAYLGAAADDDTSTEAQRWDPWMSPVLLHWEQFGNMVMGLAARSSQPVGLVSGTYAREPVAAIDAAATSRSSLFPRWTSGSVVLELRNHGEPAEFTLEYFDNRPARLGRPTVQVLVDNSPLPDADITRTNAATALPDKQVPSLLHATLDSAVVGRDLARIQIVSPTWQPARDAAFSTDRRELGILIWDLHFQSHGQDLALVEAPVSAMPVTDARPWSYELESWFYVQPQVADVWLVYLYVSGLPRWLMLIALVPAAGLVWSGRLLWQFLRRPGSFANGDLVRDRLPQHGERSYADLIAEPADHAR